MSVQWWVEGVRVEFEDAVVAHVHGQFPVATVDAVSGRPEIRATVHRDGLVHVELPGSPEVKIGMFRGNEFLRGIDWERTEAAKVKQEGERDMSEEARCYLLAERTSLERMLASLPESSVIERMSLEARKEKVEEELATMNDE